MSKKIKLTFLSITLITVLSSCADMKKMMGMEEVVLDLPSGEYIGTAKPITNEDGNKDLESLVEEEATEAEAEEEGEESEEDNQVKKLKIEKKEELQEIKITFLPKAQGLTDGVGMLLVDNSSQRFYWRSDGNATDTWNVLFFKDSNIYSNIKNTFKFDGLVTADPIENKLVGRLYMDYDGKISQYFVEAYQHFMPHIVPPKEAMVTKAGEVMEIEVEKITDDRKALSVFLLATASEEEEEKPIKLKVQRIEKVKTGNRKVFIPVKEGIEKGEYLLYVMRKGSHDSNMVPVNIE